MDTGPPNRCETCNKEFSVFDWNYQCKQCLKYCCIECHKHLPKTNYLTFDPFSDIEITDYVLCSETVCKYCYREKINPIKEKYKKSKRESGGIEIFSSKYEGKIPYESGAGRKKISSSFRRDRDEALKELRVTADYLGYDLIYDRKWDKKTKSEPSNTGDGTYKYSVWSASAIVTNHR